jgi:hypothetical protein
VKLLSLREHLDNYHERRADTHGHIYIFVRPVGAFDDVVEGKSVATGRTVTLMRPYFDEMEVPDAPQSA